MGSELDRALWDRIATIFERALEVDGAERAALLAQLCGSDHTVRREVEEMLAAHEPGHALMAERRLADLASPRPIVDAALPAGARIGPYRIVSQIGAGGMGGPGDERLHRLGIVFELRRALCPGSRAARPQVGLALAVALIRGLGTGFRAVIFHVGCRLGHLLSCEWKRNQKEQGHREPGSWSHRFLLMW